MRPEQGFRSRRGRLIRASTAEVCAGRMLEALGERGPREGGGERSRHRYIVALAEFVF